MARDTPGRDAYQSKKQRTVKPPAAMPTVGGSTFTFTPKPRKVVVRGHATPPPAAAPTVHSEPHDHPVHKAILNPAASKSAAAHQVSREHGAVPTLDQTNVWGKQIVPAVIDQANQNTQYVRPTVKPSVAHRLVPHYDGEPEAGRQGIMRYADGTPVKPGTRPKGMTFVSDQPFYTDEHTASTHKTGMELDPEAVAAINLNPQLRTASPILTGAVDAVATALPGVPTAREYTHTGQVTAGTAFGDTANTLLWAVGLGEVGAFAKELRAGADVIQAFRDARVAVKAGRVAKFEGVGLGRRETSLRGGFLDSKSRNEMIQANKKAGYSRKAQKAILEMHDQAALSFAEREGVTPQQAWDRIYKKVQYHDVNATRGDMSAHAFAQEGETPEIGNLGNTPGDIHPLPDKNFLSNASKRLLRAHDASALPDGIDTPGKLTALLNELRQRAIAAKDFKVWYANSANSIMHYVQGDVREADKVAALIAIYSPRAEVYSTKTEWNNLDRALNAYRDHQETGTVSSKWSISKNGPGGEPQTGEADWQTFRAQQIMDGNMDAQTVERLKTDRFYRNFLYHIDAAKYESMFGKERFGTMDTWMRRAFRYAKKFKATGDTNLLGEAVTSGKSQEQISKQMYAFMEQANKIVGDSLGWSPEEVQAAIWVDIKAEMEGTSHSEAGWDFGHAFAHREGRNAKPVIEQMDLAGELDQPRVDVAEKAAEMAKEPDGGFTLGINFHPDTTQVGWSASYGAYEQKTLAPLTKAQLIAYRDKHLALLKSDPTLRVGGWHNPKDGHVYLDISKVFPTHEEALAFGTEQGQLAIADLGKINRGEFDATTFTDTGLTPEAADAIKAQHKEFARLNTQSERYENVLLKAHNMWSTTKPKTVLSDAQRREVEKQMARWARDNPGPLADAYDNLAYEASLGRNSKDPEWLAQDDPLVQSIAAAQGLHVDAEAAARSHKGADLAGLPEGRTSNKTAQKVAHGYMEDAGLPYHPPTDYATVDPERAKRIAQWFDSAESAPTDPAVQASYQAMIDETLAQYEAITASGYRFEFYPAEDPYPTGPSQAIDDLRQNQHMYVYPTSEGFGTLSEAERAHPLLADSGVKWGDQSVTHNDLFRAVHDYMGHFKEGVGFRADGEENAWRAHVAMYSHEARPAMTAETRGQNSWVNYGPHGEANQTAKQMETVYADQKAVLAPDWAITEGAGNSTPIKGAVERLPSGEHALHLFRGADISTAVHEFGHALETMIPAADREALRAAGIETEEDFARSFERYFYEGVAPNPESAKAMRAIAVDMSKVYRSAEAIPGSKTSPEIRRQFGRFFEKQSKLDPSFAAKEGAAWFAQEDTSGYTFHDVNDPNAKTLNHRGIEVRISDMNRGGDGNPFHINVHDSEGKLIGSQHGFEQEGEVHASSVYVHPDHQGKGLSSQMHDMVRNYADSQGKPASAVFMNKELGKREAARSLEQGRTTYSTRQMKTYFQDSTDGAEKLAAEHNIDPQKVVGTGEGGRVLVKDVEDYVFHQMTPEDQLRSLFKGLAIRRGKQEAGYTVERGERLKKTEAVFNDTSMSPEDRLAAGKAEQAGELPKVMVNGHAREMTQDTLDHLMETVFSRANLSTWQKMRVNDALVKLVREGTVPTRSELGLMQNVWGKETTASLEEIVQNWKSLALSAVNIPRSIESTLDVSFGLRQALVMAAYDPIAWQKAYRQQFQYLSKYTGGGEKAYQGLVKTIAESENFPIYQEMKLAITDLEHEMGMREEGYQSNLAEMATIKGHGPGNIIRGSGRAYTAMALHARTSLADRLLVDAANAGQDIHDAKFLQELGHFINGITGRGKLPGRVLEESAPLLNALFFSPRLLASRVQMLNPRNYIAGNAFVRRQYLKAGLRLYGSLVSILGAVALFVPGADVGLDWRSSDFGKIKVGNTRIDLGGGFNQLFHLMGMIVTGQKKSSTTGKVSSLTDNKFGQETRADAFVKFFTGKLAPTPGMISDWANNKNPQHLGDPFDWKDEAASKFQPLIIQDVWDLYNDPAAGLNGIEAAALGYGMAAQGVGVQTYKAKEPGEKQAKTLADKAKDAGMTTPPPDVLLDLNHKAHLDSLSQDHPKDPQGRLDAYLKYLAEVTGDHSGDKWIGQKVSDEQAQTSADAIRAKLIGPGLKNYEAALKRAEKAQGK